MNSISVGLSRCGIHQLVRTNLDFSTFGLSHRLVRTYLKFATFGLIHQLVFTNFDLANSRLVHQLAHPNFLPTRCQIHRQLRMTLHLHRPALLQLLHAFCTQVAKAEDRCGHFCFLKLVVRLCGSDE